MEECLESSVINDPEPSFEIKVPKEHSVFEEKFCSLETVNSIGWLISDVLNGLKDAGEN